MSRSSLRSPIPRGFRDSGPIAYPATSLRKTLRSSGEPDPKGIRDCHNGLAEGVMSRSSIEHKGAPRLRVYSLLRNVLALA